MNQHTLTIKVEVDNILRRACEPFDYEFTGTSSFNLPPFNSPERDDTWAIGMIIGPSGSGKTHLLKLNYGVTSDPSWDPKRAVVSHFPSYEAAIERLNAVGLNSVPAWCRPYHILSNGEQFRARMARLINSNTSFDEYTSVVDRSVAKSCTNALQRFIRKQKLRGIVFSSCHYDIIEWMKPDWVFDTAKATMLPRGCLQSRSPISISVDRCDVSWWRMFKRHHYMNQNLNKMAFCYIARWDDTPIAFMAMLPQPSGVYKNAFRVHRIVVLPDYQGLSIGMRLMERVSDDYHKRGRRVFCKTMHPRMGAYFNRSKLWAPTSANEKTMNGVNKNMSNITVRFKKSCFSYEYVGEDQEKHDVILQSSKRAIRRSVTKQTTIY